MVYLVKASASPQNYDAWICGGTIVSPLYIVTSAACVEDVQYMYVIAGYNKYVKYDDINQNQCTKNRKKKVVYTCVPKAYDFEYEKLEKWAFIDLGVVKVESPYDFNDESYKNDCSYPPAPITINYEPKYQAPGLDALVLGWGHSEIWRNPSDNKDYNQEDLHYASTLLEEKELCKEAYSNVPKMDQIIDRYMICTNNPGNIDDSGNLIVTNKPLADGCFDFNQDGNDTIPLECIDTLFPSEDTRKGMNITNRITRRHGICQNDHGGPIITWLGTHEILIGVASVFRVTNESKCEGPYLFTSTQCNGAFLDCVVNGENSTRRSLCNKPPAERGFHMIQRTISWTHHPDGPAENEIMRLRPVLPIRGR
ncbi:uncharacterized protein [Epargyreus clarus]|uniref:uncharacterized protein n=1 Tax=Epargyreus clarus TaxID=520877 RepID=UPI003C2AE3CF